MARVDITPTAGDVPPMPDVVVSAEMIQGLRGPSGERPCSGQLRRALKWIGDRTMSLAAAVSEAAKEGLDTAWALHALGLAWPGRVRGRGRGRGRMKKKPMGNTMQKSIAKVAIS